MNCIIVLSIIHVLVDDCKQGLSYLRKETNVRHTSCFLRKLEVYMTSDYATMHIFQMILLRINYTTNNIISILYND